MFEGVVTSGGTGLAVSNTSGPPDQKYTDLVADNSGNLTFRLVNDAYTSFTTFMQVVRSGITTSAITLTAPTITLTGATAVSSSLTIGTAPAVGDTSNAVPTTAWIRSQGYGTAASSLNTVGTLTAGVGQNAAIVISQVVNVTVLVATNGVTLPTLINAPLGTYVFLSNTSGNNGLLYPDSGSKCMNNGILYATNGSVMLASYMSYIAIRVSPTLWALK